MKYLLSFGGNSPVVAEGEHEGEELNLRYKFDGTEYRLTLGENRLEHASLGETGMRLEFVRGVRTVGEIRCGAVSAPYPIFCRELNVVNSSQGVRVAVTFTAEGEEERHTEILISARGK